MHDLALLRDLVILVAAAIPVVAVAQRLGIPGVVAFLLTGVAIGPLGLRLIGDQRSVAGLAEVGVVLLLFTIGLELSLSRVARMGRLVLQGGGLQVLGTIALASMLALALGVPAPVAVLSGSLVALSSTAIVLRVLAERGELDTPQGRVVVAILLFQDLCVAPLMLAIPLLAGAGTDAGSRLSDFTLGLAALGLLAGGGRWLVPRVLDRIAALRNREIFTLSIVFLGLGAAYVTAAVGLSLAIGAFVAGLVISESEYGMQALSDVLPFRDTFSGIFFISVGMLLDWHLLLDRPLALVGGTAALIVLKTAVAALAASSLGNPLHVSLMGGLTLAQVGEFSFVLAGVAAPLGLLPPASYQLFLGASVLSMLAAPFVIAGAEPLARAVARWAGRPAWRLPGQDAAHLAQRHDHVIIVGYGLNGRNLARVLRAAGIGYVILEQNAQAVRRGRLAGEPIFFGDGTRHDVLARVGIERARVIVFAISAPAAERRGVAVARALSPAVRIVVRTRYVAAMEDLQRAGADEVVPEEFETSLEIFARVLRLYGVPSNVIEREVQAVRSEHYGVLRGLEPPDLRLDALRHLGVHAAMDTVEVEAGSPAVGQSPTSMDLRRATGATVIAVVRQGRALYTPDPAFRFQPGDTAVLVGERETLDRACAYFRAPRGGPGLL
jgi:CPA2 family monovalent cation:H+ antiporter-2